MPQPPWQNWHHCMVSTYGTWLPGDPRGWHERNHHEHVPGDYKNPPAETAFSRGRWAHSKDIMRFTPFFIPQNHLERIGSWLLDALHDQGIPAAAIVVAPTNFHALLRYKGPNCKVMLGKVKAKILLRWKSHLNDAWPPDRPMWAAGSLPKPIHDKTHGDEVFQYLLDHAKKGAWVWSHRPRQQ